MAATISFLNLKGGVGKTSLIVNVASCLAYMGKRVLVVDLDAQSNASIWLMRLDRWNTLNREPKKFVLNLFLSAEASLRDCIQKSVVKGPQGDVLLNSLDLVPASFRLMDLEHEIENQLGQPFHLRLFEALKTVENDYDFILLDCPPNFLFATQCAAFSSQHVMVPANADALSIIGFHLLVDKLERFKARTLEERKSVEAPCPEVLGISLNAVKQGARIDVPLQRFHSQIDRFRDQGKLPAHTLVFPEQIRHSVAVGRSVLQGLPMVLMSQAEASLGLAEDYIKTAQRIEEMATELGQEKVAETETASPTPAPNPAV